MERNKARRLIVETVNHLAPAAAECQHDRYQTAATGAVFRKILDRIPFCAFLRNFFDFQKCFAFCGFLRLLCILTNAKCFTAFS